MEKPDFENRLLHELMMLRDTLNEQIEQQKNTTRQLMTMTKYLERIQSDIDEMSMDVAAIKRGD